MSLERLNNLYVLRHKKEKLCFARYHRGLSAQA